MGKGTLFLCLLLVMLAASACSLGNTVGTDACNEEGTLFSDNFDGTSNCGWTLYERAGASVEITNGVLQLSTSQTGQIWWANPGRNFGDVIITVQARQVSGPDDNAYGVFCRYQSPESYYLFLISGDGFYAIGKFQSGNEQVQYLTGEGEFAFSDAINQGAAANAIRASCIGNELSLAVNGIPLDTVTDPTFVTGDIGLGVSTFQPGTAVIQFDDLRVIAP